MDFTLSKRVGHVQVYRTSAAGEGMFSSKSLSPNEVFTPRSHDINQRTYAERPHLEKRLQTALRGDKYIILHGESGNGKTWLYKKVLRQLDLRFEVINLANMHLEGSLNAVLEAKLGDLGSSSKSASKTEIDGGIRPAGIGGGIKEVTEYRSSSSAAFNRLVKELSMTAGGKPSVLVLDNFEQVVDQSKFLREIASLIISADDDSIAQHRVKILIVGTPTNIRHLISHVSSATTISNRFVEIPEVARMEMAEARYIMAQGFEKHLQLTPLLDKNDLYRQISWKTDRIAQHIQELCLKIAIYAEENRSVLNQKVVEQAEKDWIEETLSSDKSVVEALMNTSQETKVGRKNQVLYILGAIATEDFRFIDVEKSLRSTFDVDKDLNLNVIQILSGFAKADTPLIRKMPTGNTYRFCSPKFKMAVRTMLRLNSEKKVVKVY